MNKINENKLLLLKLQKKKAPSSFYLLQERYLWDFEFIRLVGSNHVLKMDVFLYKYIQVI